MESKENKSDQDVDAISYVVEKIQKKNSFTQVTEIEWNKSIEHKTYILEDDLWRSIEKNNDLGKTKLEISLEKIKKYFLDKFRFQDFNRLAYVETENKNLCLLKMIQKHDDHLYHANLGKYFNLINYRSQKSKKNCWKYGTKLKIINFNNNTSFYADIVIFLNGLPIILFHSYKKRKEIQKSELTQDQLDEELEVAYSEVKNNAFKCPDFFNYLCFGVVFSKHKIKYGSFQFQEKQNNKSKSENLNNFSEWNYTKKDCKYIPEKENMIEGSKINRFFSSFFTIEKLHEFIRYFIFYKKEKKIIAKYYQYYAVKHFEDNVKEIQKKYEENDQEWLNQNKNKGGFAYHTPGAGKSFEMVFLVKKLQAKNTRHADFNQKFLIITDRVALDNQISTTFKNSFENKNNIIQIQSRASLRTQIREKTGGIFCTTIHKFLDLKNDDEKVNYKKQSLKEKIIDEKIIVIVDEAHRTQAIKHWKNKEKEPISSFAEQMRHDLPKGIFIGFTGTPVITEDEKNKNLSLYEKEVVTLTEDLFGKKKITYNLIQALNDRSIVPVSIQYHEYDLKPILNNKNFIQNTAKNIFNSWKNAYLKNKKNRNDKSENISAMMIVKNRFVAFKYYLEFNKLIKEQEWNKQAQKDHGWNFKVVISVSDFNQDYINRMSEDEKKEIDNFWDKIKKDQKNTKTSQDNFANSSNDISCFDFVIVVDKWQTGVDFPRMSYMFILKELKKDLQIIQTISRVVRKFKDIKKYGGIIHDFINEKETFNNALKAYCSEKEKNSFFKDQNDLKKDLVKKFRNFERKFPEIIKLAKDYKNIFQQSLFKKSLEERKKEIFENYIAEKRNYNKQNDDFNYYDKKFEELDELYNNYLNNELKQNFLEKNLNFKIFNKFIIEVVQKSQVEIEKIKTKENQFNKKNNFDFNNPAFTLHKKNTSVFLTKDDVIDFKETAITKQEYFGRINIITINLEKIRDNFEENIQQHIKKIINSNNKKLLFKRRNSDTEDGIEDLKENIEDLKKILKRSSQINSYIKIIEIEKKLNNIKFPQITTETNFDKLTDQYKKKFTLIKDYITNILVIVENKKSENPNACFDDIVKQEIIKFSKNYSNIQIKEIDDIGKEIFREIKDKTRRNEESLYERLITAHYNNCPGIRAQINRSFYIIIEYVIKKHFLNLNKFQSEFEELVRNIFDKLNKIIETFRE